MYAALFKDEASDVQGRTDHICRVSFFYQMPPFIDTGRTC
ncbi:hypothetical protein CHCC14600_1923 [Bacillus licheniformis]|nr:hypothetical protein CHCC20327_2120 [Bacillus licheniformis]TWM89288.1 hypothetical protein CHCC14600_1923 [Bacillus licheniformis]